jgi:hypothetical protein
VPLIRCINLTRSRMPASTADYACESCHCPAKSVELSAEVGGQLGQRRIFGKRLNHFRDVLARACRKGRNPEIHAENGGRDQDHSGKRHAPGGAVLLA